MRLPAVPDAGAYTGNRVIRRAPRIPPYARRIGGRGSVSQRRPPDAGIRTVRILAAEIGHSGGAKYLEDRDYSRCPERNASIPRRVSSVIRAMTFRSAPARIAVSKVIPSWRYSSRLQS
jgi:hypothetical protein